MQITVAIASYMESIYILCLYTVPETSIKVSVTSSKSIMDIILYLNPQLLKLNIKLLEPLLNQNGILTEEERQYLQLPVTNHDKIQYLLMHLECKDIETQKDFIKAIYQSSQQSGGRMHCKIIKLFEKNGVKVCEENL